MIIENFRYQVMMDFPKCIFKSRSVMTTDLCLILAVLIMLAIWAVCSNVPVTNNNNNNNNKGSRVTGGVVPF